MQFGHIAPCLHMLPIYACFAVILAAEASLLFCIAYTLHLFLWARPVLSQVSMCLASRLSCTDVAFARALLESQWLQGLWQQPCRAMTCSCTLVMAAETNIFLQGTGQQTV